MMAVRVCDGCEGLGRFVMAVGVCDGSEDL